MLLIQDATGIPIDVSLGGMPFEERCIQRASQWELPESESITTCSASDLVKLKEEPEILEQLKSIQEAEK